MIEELRLVAADGYTLAATLATPAGEPHTVVLVAPALGAPRRLYHKWLRYLADEGFAALVIDYRGVGDSAPRQLRGFQATLLDWARLDLSAAADMLRLRFPGVPTTWFGHSIGGQLLGLLPSSAGPVDRVLLVGTAHGHWRNWRGLRRAGAWALWHLMPLLTAVLGALPMRAAGQGMDVPRGAALQWAEWGRDPRYIGRAADDLPDAVYHHLSAPVRSISIADDNHAPPAGISPLLALYKQAPTEVITLHPDSEGMRRIGHFGVFRRSSLFPSWARYLRGVDVVGKRA